MLVGFNRENGRTERAVGLMFLGRGFIGMEPRTEDIKTSEEREGEENEHIGRG
jgi:hypothetical protein